MGRGSPDGGQDRARRLPRDIIVRLADFRPHYEALLLALEQTGLEQFQTAARLRRPAELNQHVYPIERSFELLCNYVSELNELGLRETGIEPGDDRRTNLRLLAREKVISGEQERKLWAALSARNELAHEYPDVRAAGIYQAARDLVAEAPVYMRDYVAWMRRLGFGDQSS